MGNQCCASSTNAESNDTETFAIGNYATQSQISIGSYVYCQNTTVYNCNRHHSCKSQLRPWQILLPVIWQHIIICQSIPHGNKFGLPWSTGQVCEGFWRQTQWYTMAHKNRSDQVQNSKPAWENMASMGIHQKGNVLTKTQQKALFGNCARNCIKKIFKHTVQDDYRATDTHTQPRLCN